MVTDIQRMLGEHLCRLAGWDDNGPKCYCNCQCCMGQCDIRWHEVRNHIPGFCSFDMTPLVNSLHPTGLHHNPHYRPTHRPVFTVQDFGPDDDEDEQDEATDATNPPAYPGSQASPATYPDRPPDPPQTKDQPPSGSDAQAASTAEEGPATGEHESLETEAHDGQGGTAPDDGTKATSETGTPPEAPSQTPAPGTIAAPTVTGGIDNRPPTTARARSK